MKKFKLIGFVVGIMLFIFSGTLFYFGIKGLSTMHPASDYMDMGIHTFAPHRILPVQVENQTTGRDKHNNPTKTVYMVAYTATDGTGYGWNVEGGSTRKLAQNLYNQGVIEWRVLTLPSDNTYITIESEQTAESYTDKLGQQYRRILIFAGGYLLIYVIAWCVIWIRRKKNRERKSF